MRSAFLLVFLLVGCGDAKSEEEQRTNGYVVPANGDPGNYTWSGFPRHRYAACGTYIELEKPFEVVPDGWGEDPLVVPLSYLDDPLTKARAPEGSDKQNRVEFAFPSRYRGTGMSEWQALAGGYRFVIKPLSEAVAFLNSDQARHSNGTGGQSHFQGVVNGHDVAMTCSAVNWPNPSCEAEVALGVDGQRFLANFPPKSVNRLGRMVVIGTKLFSEAARSCGPESPPRRTEIEIFNPSVKTKRY